jgi:serine/threonine protein kinase
VLQWTEQIFKGLSVLHSTVPRIVHYDITLTNVMVTNKNSIKIIDVGDSVIGENNSKHWQYANAYSSPERYWLQRPTWRQRHPLLIAEYETKFAEKDDIWAVAIMISELVTGKRVTVSRVGAGFQGSNVPVNEVLLKEMTAEVDSKSMKLGAVVHSILSQRFPDKRLSASDILQAHSFY